MVQAYRRWQNLAQDNNFQLLTTHFEHIINMLFDSVSGCTLVSYCLERDIDILNKTQDF